MLDLIGSPVIASDGRLILSLSIPGSGEIYVNANFLSNAAVFEDA